MIKNNDPFELYDKARHRPYLRPFNQMNEELRMTRGFIRTSIKGELFDAIASGTPLSILEQLYLPNKFFNF